MALAHLSRSEFVFRPDQVTSIAISDDSGVSTIEYRSDDGSIITVSMALEPDQLHRLLTCIAPPVKGWVQTRPSHTDERTCGPLRT